jgi:hypothetical protein
MPAKRLNKGTTTMTNTTKPIKLNKNGTPRKKWTSTGKVRKTKSGDGHKFPLKIQVLVTHTQNDFIANLAASKGVTSQDIIRDMINSLISSS